HRRLSFPESRGPCSETDSHSTTEPVIAWGHPLSPLREPGEVLASNVQSIDRCEGKVDSRRCGDFFIYHCTRGGCARQGAGRCFALILRNRHQPKKQARPPVLQTSSQDG